jgi:hypothetical protein
MEQDTPRIRQRTLRVPLDATLTRPWARGQRWTAEAGHFRSDGATEKGAADALAAGVAGFLQEYRPPTVLTFRGHVVVVAVEMSIDAGRRAFHMEYVRPDGSRYSFIDTESSLAEAEAYARYELAQNATDWHDDASVQGAAAYVAGLGQSAYGLSGSDEIYRYAAWQRAAKVARDANRDDWHEWASDHASDYAVPRAEPVSVLDDEGVTA